MKLYDLTYISEIAEGDTVFFNSMVDIFVQYTPLALDEIKEALSIKDFDRIRKVAHRIKPSINSLKINCIAENIRVLTLLDEHKLSEAEITKHVALIDEALLAAIKQIRKELIK